MLRFDTPLLSTVTAVLALGLIGTAIAHDYQAGDLVIDHPWARATAPQQANGAAYLTVTNDGGAADRLIEARSPVAGRVELHTHEVDSAGVMRMREVDGIDLPAGGTTALRPGALHVMLIGLGDRLAEGETFPLTLVFEQAGSVEVEVQVEAVTFGIAGEDDEHEHEHGAGQGHSH